MKGLIHIYCGDGKGKTTCAMGLAVRCAGAGEKVLIYQFMKGNSSSERTVLNQISNITLLDGVPRIKFSFQMTEEEKEQLAFYYKGIFKEITEKLQTGNYRMVVMDEIISTVNLGLLDIETVEKFLKTKPEHLEVVMTGREPKESLCELADYITEMKKNKHPFDQGIGSRKAIEY